VAAQAWRMCGNEALMKAQRDILLMASERPGERPWSIFWTRTFSKFWLKNKV